MHDDACTRAYINMIQEKACRLVGVALSLDDHPDKHHDHGPNDIDHKDSVNVEESNIKNDDTTEEEKLQLIELNKQRNALIFRVEEAVQRNKQRFDPPKNDKLRSLLNRILVDMGISIGSRRGRHPSPTACLPKPPNQDNFFIFR